MARLPVLALGALLFLPACGNMADLQPARGQSMPVKPLMAQKTPTVDDLLRPPTFANPDRVDELMRRSAPRMSDRFDLPPPNGGASDIPVQAQDDTDENSNDKGPVTPQ